LNPNKVIDSIGEEGEREREGQREREMESKSILN
jgi:hypothetical protein